MTGTITKLDNGVGEVVKIDEDVRTGLIVVEFYKDSVLYDEFTSCNIHEINHFVMNRIKDGWSLASVLYY